MEIRNILHFLSGGVKPGGSADALSRVSTSFRIQLEQLPELAERHAGNTWNNYSFIVANGSERLQNAAPAAHGRCRSENTLLLERQ
jgi:hypothetical protein